ncbi:MAG: methionine ABC transporter ATP-binding protein [Anaerococcus sp.]|nr:methionine ABC transporter ATP-binding protein [Anaerococcus sp.]
MIRLEDVSVDFDGFKAVDRVSLEVNKGDSYGIVGFSGAGKSTLIRTVNLLQRVSSGEVFVNGENLLDLDKKALREKRKKIGMIFQHFNLLNNLSVIDNVIFPIKEDKIPRKEKEAKALRLLDLVGIRDKKDKFPRELSGGQKQRCAIARALMSDPDILLCDEATSALDPKTTKQILKLLKSLNKDLGLTILIITHQMEVVKDLCNKTAIMSKGRIIEKGSTLEIFSNPKNPLTKEFVESTTRLDSMIEDVKDKLGILNKGELLVKLNYLGEITSKPLISEIYEKFGVRANILAGSIEFINQSPFGTLILTFMGDVDMNEKAIAYLREKNLGVEILGGKDGIL